MSDFKGLFTVRPAKELDKNFILATMLRGVYYGDSWFSKIPKDIFMDNYKYAAEALINNPNTIINIACLPDDNDVILGYSVLGNAYHTVHWVYVKSAWRKKGIANALLPKLPTVVTHLTAVGEILLKKYPTAIFNPFAINQ
jgi:GNAT superfamily N-acetyltransferase